MAESKTDKRQRTVGLLFWGGMAVLALYTIFLTGVWKGKTKTFFVSFPKVHGLKVGDRVRAEGLDVGEVVDMRLVESPRGGLRINAWLRVKANVEIYKAGSDVRVTPFSPLGGRVVEILRGHESPQGRHLALEDQPEPNPVAIDGTADGELLQTLTAIVEENRESVNRIVKNLETVSVRLTQPDSGVIGMLLNDKGAAVKMDEITTELRDAVTSLNTVLGRLERGEGVLGELTTKNGKLHDDVVGAAEAARGTLEEARATLKRANEGKSALGVLVADESQGGATSDVKGIAHDLSLIAGDVQAGKGTVGKLFKDGRLYEGAADTAENLGRITARIDKGKGAVGVLVSDEDAGRMVKSTLERLERIATSVDEKEGALGLVIKDKAFRDRVARIFEEVERTVVEFRDSVEDLREQAPVNAFLGTVFAAF